MITIILNHHKKYAEVEMPAMYEELQLALWKLGLDRAPEKYTLQDLDATFRYQSPLEYFVLRLLEGGMSLLDAVSAIYTVIAPPRPIMAQVQILSSGFRSITELRQEIDRMIKSSAQFGSTCFFPGCGRPHCPVLSIFQIWRIQMSKAPTPREAAQIRLNYPPGTRIELELMVDAYAVPPGTRGTVDHVDDMGNVHTKWDNGRTLSAIPGVDNFRKLTAQELQEEQQGMAVPKMEAPSL